jgi:hypothetical protein
LPVPDVLQLRLTCVYFYNLVQPSHQELLQAESSDWARHQDLYTCRYCLRLRPQCNFADRMLHRRRSRASCDSDRRFCIECGLKPRDGSARYGPGAQVTVQGAHFVLCLACRQFEPGAQDRNGRNVLLCLSCWRESQAVKVPAEDLQ